MADDLYGRRIPESAPRLLEVTAGRRQLSEQPAVIHQPARNQVRHVPFALQRAVHSHEPGTEQLAALFVDQGRPDDDVDPSSLVLEGHEDRARCGTGSLAAG